MRYDDSTRQVTLSKDEIDHTDIRSPGRDDTPGGLYETLRPDVVSHEDVDVDVSALARADRARRPDGDVGDVSASEGQTGLEGGVQLPRADLPGFGEANDTCGLDTLRFCGGCGKPHYVGATCQRSTCPRCAPSWARKRATTVGAKLNAARRVYDTRHQERVKYHHAFASTPPDYLVDADDPKEALSRAFDFVKKLALAMGFDMGKIFYHPYRLEDEDDVAIGAEHNDDRGRWKELLFNGWDDEENEELGIGMDEVRDDLNFWPHFHIIGVAPFVAGGDIVDELHDRTGWIFGRITGRSERQNVSVYGDEELARALTYSISHSGLLERADGSTEYQAREFGDGWSWIEADEETQKHMDETTRAVAPDTLGIPYSRLKCTVDIDDLVDQESSDVPSPSIDVDSADESASGSGSGSGSGSAGGSASGISGASASRSAARGFGNAPPEERGELRSGSGGVFDYTNSSAPRCDVDIPDVTGLPEPRLRALRSMSPDQLVSYIDGVDDQNVYRYIEALENAEAADVCGGRLLMADKAVRHLADEDWRREAAFADELIDAIDELVGKWEGDPPDYFSRSLLEDVEDVRRGPGGEWADAIELPPAS